MVPQRWVFRVYALKLASDESLSRQDMGLSTTKGVVRLQVLEDTVVLKKVDERGEEATTSPAGLIYPKAKRQLERRWTRRSTTIPQRWIYRLRRKGCRCKVMDSRAMGLVASWYHRGETSVESSIPCSHRGGALVIKGVEEVENIKANSKYQDRADGQRPRNFIRLPSNIAFSTTKRMGEVKYPISLTYPAEELCISSFDYSTTTTKSGWEPKGRVATKAED
ncbi:hypothetical protein BHM03_00029178 [Ensete ventricosum]|nr:hypothetical protein BHM03_00029178 [Ensete ventricosum]